ncbi:MAG: B12-binding domain-containing radical SAM protein [Candidatus Bathyarchaeota archaeon]|nr:B12-binding domain-containing radical SAM protein [Candidatus Bathyarchaeota archaeon]
MLREETKLIFLMTTAPPEHSPWSVPMRLPPLGLSYVAAALEKAGFKVELLDNYLLRKSISDVKEIVKHANPEIVGMTCSSASYPRCVETAKAIKETLPSSKIVVGGWHPSYVPESMLQHEAIDYVIVGEGERAMVELASCITKGDEAAARQVAGVAYRKDGKIVQTAQRFIKNLDELPFPARHLLPMHLYEKEIPYLKAKPFTTMNIVRGCPFNCVYCETRRLWGQTCRIFSPQRVIAEIKHLTEKYGIKGIYFVGDNFTINKKQTMELCELIIKSKLDIEWVCDTRADMISRELLQAMKAAGCRTIWFGVESGSPRILEKINKGITIEQTEQAFKLCREAGIRIASSFIMGIPGETLEDIDLTYKFAKKLDPDWAQFNVYVAVPGSGLYDEVMQKGLYDRLENFIAYVKTDEFNYESLLAIQKRYQADMDLSPRRILKKMQREGFWTVMKKAPRYLRRFL